MYAAATSVALVGGDPLPVRVEAHVGRPENRFRLSGLPDTAVREAKDRVRAAVASSGIRFPNRSVTVNLAPADLPKRGTDYDLPIALGILSATRDLPNVDGLIAVGELALDGSVRSGSHALAAGVLSARQRLPCLVAEDAAADAAAVPGSVVYGVATLAQAIELVRMDVSGTPPTVARARSVRSNQLDLSDIKGQKLARRALEIAAAGGHHLLLHGPPGAGKTMLARRMVGIIPDLTPDEAIETAMVWEATGRRRGLDPMPPFRSPHHTASKAALIGGGSGNPVPGEVSLAHRGILFLDELAEFPRSHLDTLRQPLEEGKVSVARRGVSVDFPASFQLVAATNPCPCGYYGDNRRPCDCRPAARARYRSRISGPLLDRFDLIVEVARVEASEYDGPDGELSETVSTRVARAREAQSERGSLNRDLPASRQLERSGVSQIIRAAIESGMVTARGADRVRKVARTIGDLRGDELVTDEHVAEALALRGEWRVE
ncbi:MAG: YifB family Mg chelatase-like AAA ATPase [Acidimicrobiia bacterium]